MTREKSGIYALPRVTLREIAKAAGVSSTTVSNVINDKSGMMTVSTRKSIERLIKEMNYRPHSTGRNLKLARSLAIGLLIVDDSPTFLADPFNTYIVAGLSNHLSKNGYGLIIQGLPARDFATSFMIRNHETDALCVIPSGPAAHRRQIYERLKRNGQPILVFQDRLPAGLRDGVSIRQNDRRGGRMLAKRLVDRGARRLVMLVPSHYWPATAERQRGVREALKRDGAKIELDVVGCTSEGLADTQQALAAYVGEHGWPDAVLGGNDQMGIAALKWVLAQGLKVPGDIMITGFNAFDFRTYVSPTLTTVRSPAYEMGERGGTEILARLKSGRFGQRAIVLDVALESAETG